MSSLQQVYLISIRHPVGVEGENAGVKRLLRAGGRNTLRHRCVPRGMKIILSDPGVPALVREHGGKLFVRTDPHKCCTGALTYLKTGSGPEPGRHYRLFETDGFELWFDPGSAGPPDELHLDIKGWRTKRIEAYWNGCAYAN